MISSDFSKFRTKIWSCAEDQRKEEERLFEIEFRVTEFVIQSIPIAHPIYLKNHDVFIRITALHIFQFKNYKGGYTAPVSMSNCTGYTDAGTRKLCRHRDHVEKKEKEKGRSFSHVRGTSCASSARRIPTNLSWPVTPVRRGEEGRRRRRGIRKRRERI